MKLCKFQILSTHYLIAIAILLQFRFSNAVKVLDINDKLPELIEKHPEKGWLVKFYAPWCHHCQQLEPIFNNVAEQVYSKHNDLIVGRVDCTKTGGLCGKYGVDAYPTIIYIDKDSQVKYRGDRSEHSMVAFAERLQGPTVNVVHDCKELARATNKHSLVILSTIPNATNEIRKEFESLAQAYKSTYWFYQYFGVCESPYIQDEGLYVLKQHLSKPIKFNMSSLGSRPSDDDNVPNDEPQDLEKIIISWLNKESFPVYGQISYRNIEKALGTDKLLVIAVLDEYKPARRFSPTSREFHKRMEEIAMSLAAEDDQILIGWSSDLELVQYITITPVSTPNVIVLKADFSYHLFLSDSKNNGGGGNQDESGSVSDKVDAEWLAKLSDANMRSLLARARAEKLVFTGGSSYMMVIMRYIMGNLNKFLTMYKANPLLVSLIFGFPTVIIIFVIYTTCFYDGPERRDEDELDDEDHDSEYDDDDDEESQQQRQLLSNGHHLKQE